VDDIHIASKRLSTVEVIKSSLLDKCSGRDLAATKFFFQMPVERDRESRLLVPRQQLHIEELADVASLSDAWPVRVPIITGLYRDALGDAVTAPTILLYVNVCWVLSCILRIEHRPDVEFAVSYLARFVNAPTTDKFAHVVDIIKYFKGTSSYGLYLGGSAVNYALYGLYNADFAACPVTRRSVTGYVIKCGLGAITWKSVRQATARRSTAESEYIATGELSKEVQ
jgi:hypothetical protein